MVLVPMYIRTPPIMGHDCANKYANYYAKKQKTIKSGNLNYKDSGKQKTLQMQSLLLLQNIENYIQTIKKLQYQLKGTQKLFNKIAKSKTIKSYVRTKLVQLRKIIIQLL